MVMDVDAGRIRKGNFVDVVLVSLSDLFTRLKFQVFFTSLHTKHEEVCSSGNGCGCWKN